MGFAIACTGYAGDSKSPLLLTVQIADVILAYGPGCLR